MGTVEDCLLDVRSQQDRAQDAGRIAGAGDPFIGGNRLDALILAPGQPAVPAVGPDQGVDQRDIPYPLARFG